jgi:hypothetical protein
MAYRRIVAAVALQRYLDFTPIAVRIRDLAALLARACGASLTILSIDAPVELLPGVETTADKLERLCEPLRAAGMEVAVVLREGRPSKVISEVVAELGPIWWSWGPTASGARSTSGSAARPRRSTASWRPPCSWCAPGRPNRRPRASS